MNLRPAKPGWRWKEDMTSWKDLFEVFKNTISGRWELWMAISLNRKTESIL